MTTTRHLQRSRRARAVAVLALLFACGSQALEATHNHAHDGSVVECLSCKNSSDGAAHFEAPPVATTAERDTQPVQPALAARAVLTRPYDSRGPPHLS